MRRKAFVGRQWLRLLLRHPTRFGAEEVPLDEQAIGDKPRQREETRRSAVLGRFGANISRKLGDGQPVRQRLLDQHPHRLRLIDQRVRGVAVDLPLEQALKHTALVIAAPPRADGIDRTRRRDEMRARMRQALKRLQAVFGKTCTVLVFQLYQIEQPAVTTQPA